MVSFEIFVDKRFSSRPAMKRVHSCDKMEFLTPQEVAKVLKVSQWFVYHNRELLGGVKIGKLIRFSKEGIYERLLSSRELVDRHQTEREENLQGGGIQERTGRQNSGEGKEGKSNGDKYGLYQALRESVGRPGSKKK